MPFGRTSLSTAEQSNHGGVHLGVSGILRKPMNQQSRVRSHSLRYLLQQAQSFQVWEIVKDVRQMVDKRALDRLGTFVLVVPHSSGISVMS